MNKILNIKNMLSIALLLALIVFNIQFTNAQKITIPSNVWHVACIYGEGGDLTGGSCTTGGTNSCACPASIIK